MILLNRILGPQVIIFHDTKGDRELFSCSSEAGSGILNLSWYLASHHPQNVPCSHIFQIKNKLARLRRKSPLLSDSSKFLMTLTPKRAQLQKLTLMVED